MAAVDRVDRQYERRPPVIRPEEHRAFHFPGWCQVEHQDPRLLVAKDRLVNLPQPPQDRPDQPSRVGRLDRQPDMQGA